LVRFDTKFGVRRVTTFRYGKMVVDEKVPAGGGSGTTVSLWVMVMFASS